MSMVRCSQCGAAFSSHRTSCPACGAERNKGGARLKKKKKEVNVRLVISILLALAIIVCLIILATMIFGGGDETNLPDSSPSNDVTTGNDITSPDTTTASPDVSPDDTSPVVSPDVTDNTNVEGTQPGIGTVGSIDFTNIYFYPEIQGYEVSFNVGDSFTFKVETDPEGEAVSWSSSNESVITVDENGKVTAVNTGTATLTATAGEGASVSVSCNIIVN